MRRSRKPLVVVKAARGFESLPLRSTPKPLHRAVTIDGDLTSGRADWMAALVAESEQGRLEALIAWGKSVLLDTSHTVEGSEEEPPLAQLRADLIGEYPPVGPIFA